MLGLAVAEHLFHRFPERAEGDLARIRAHVVSRASCARVARELELGAALVSEGRRRGVEEAGLPARTTAVMAALIEAAIGAVFLANGAVTTSEAVIDAFAERVAYAVDEHVDHKTVLQETLARQGHSVTYELVETTGPPHRRRFTSRAVVEDRELGRGSGPTKKHSEQQAAREALEGIEAPP